MFCFLRRRKRSRRPDAVFRGRKLRTVLQKITLNKAIFKVAKLLHLVKELIKVLKNDGWQEKDQKGSHPQLIHPNKLGKVTIPVHGGDIPKGTLNSILKQAGLK